MKCLFTETILPIGDIIQIEGNVVHHLLNVLRMKKGETLDIKDDKYSYQTNLENIQKDILHFKIKSKRNLIPQLKAPILCPSLIKGNAFELILEKATELGVNLIIPYISNRNIIKLDSNKMQTKVNRWKVILKEASQQCGRDFIPEIYPPINSFKELSIFSEYSPILLHEKLLNMTIKDAIENTNDKIIFIIGPEGGFDSNEIHLARQLDFIISYIPGNILRSETASLYALSSFFYHVSSGHQSTS